MYLLPCNIGDGVQHCLASMDSDLEAFSRNPTDGSFATLAFQLTTFTKYLNEVFLSGKTNLSHGGLNPDHVPC